MSEANQILLKKLLRRALEKHFGFRMCQQCCRQNLVHRLGTRLFCSSCAIEAFAKAGLDLSQVSPLDLLPFYKGFEVWAKIDSVMEPAIIAYRDDRRGGFGVRFLAGGRRFCTPTDLMVRAPGQVVFGKQSFAKAG